MPGIYRERASRTRALEDAKVSQAHGDSAEPTRQAHRNVPISLQGYTIPWTGTEVPEARAYKKFLVKQRSYFLRCGAVTEMSLISSNTGSATAASALKAAACEPAGGTLPWVCPLARVCVGTCGISTRLLFDAGPSWPSTEASLSYTKRAMSLNKVVRAGVSGPTTRRQHGPLADSFSKATAFRNRDSFSLQIDEKMRKGSAYRQLSGSLPGCLVWTERRDPASGRRAAPTCYLGQAHCQKTRTRAAQWAALAKS